MVSFFLGLLVLAALYIVVFGTIAVLSLLIDAAAFRYTLWRAKRAARLSQRDVLP